MIKLSEDEKKIIAKRSNFIPFFHILFRFLAHFFLCYGVYFGIKSSNYPMLIALMYINSILWHFWGYAGIAHELYHGTVFTSKKVNKLLFFICSYLTWNNPYFFAKSHKVHHNKIFSVDDNEVYRVLPGPLILCVRYIIFDYVTMVKQIVYCVTNLIGRQLNFDGNSIVVVMIRKDRWIIASHAFLILFLNVGMSWIMYKFAESWLFALIILITPFTGRFLNSMLAIVQHIGLEGCKNKGWLYNSRTINLPIVLRFFYANMNYHAEHHLIPYVPYYRLPLLNALIKQKAVDRLPEVGSDFLMSKYLKFHMFKLALKN